MNTDSYSEYQFFLMANSHQEGFVDLNKDSNLHILAIPTDRGIEKGIMFFDSITVAEDYLATNGGFAEYSLMEITSEDKVKQLFTMSNTWWGCNACFLIREHGTPIVMGIKERPKEISDGQHKLSLNFRLSKKR